MTIKVTGAVEVIDYTKTNVFMILGGRQTYVDPSSCPWQAFQWFLPCRKVDFLFGAN